MNIFHKRQYQWRITTTNSTISVDENVLMVCATGTSTLQDFVFELLKSVLIKYEGGKEEEQDLLRKQK